MVQKMWLDIVEGNRKPNTNHCSDAVLAFETEMQVAKGGGIVPYIVKLNEDLQ